MTDTRYGAAAKLSSLCFRIAATLLMLMVPIFVIGRVLGLSQQPANVALALLGMTSALAALVGSIAVVWDS